MTISYVAVGVGVSVGVGVTVGVLVDVFVGFLVGTAVGGSSRTGVEVKVGVSVLTGEGYAPGTGVKTGRRAVSPWEIVYWLLIQQSAMPESGLRTKRYAPLSSRANDTSSSPSSQSAILGESSVRPARQERPSTMTVTLRKSGKAMGVKVYAPVAVKPGVAVAGGGAAVVDSLVALGVSVGHVPPDAGVGAKLINTSVMMPGIHRMKKSARKSAIPAPAPALSRVARVIAGVLCQRYFAGILPGENSCLSVHASKLCVRQ